jgi:hypothetical protein
MFDVNGGALLATRCHTMGLIVAALVIDIAAHARFLPENGTITVTSQCWGSVWACTVSDNGIKTQEPSSPYPPQIVLRLARRLNAQLAHHVTKDGRATSFMFKPFYTT